MVKITAEWATGDETEANAKSASVFLNRPMFTATSTYSHRRMVREEIVVNEAFYHVSLFLAEYTSQNP